MKWRVVIRPEVEQDVAKAAAWYNRHSPGLGAGFVEEVIQGDALETDPLTCRRRYSEKDIRWKYPNSFPFRVIYEVNESKNEVVVVGVLHAARSEREWLKRVG